MFRPAGITPGHALEWSRLLIQLYEIGQRKYSWMLFSAKKLFSNACKYGWAEESGGFYYTLDWTNKPIIKRRFWWPCAEGIASASVLKKSTGDPYYELWYRRIWSFVATHFIDRNNGGWFPELDLDLRPVNQTFCGKPDLYHSIQACLIPLLPINGSVTKQLEERTSIGLFGEFSG